MDDELRKSILYGSGQENTGVGTILIHYGRVNHFQDACIKGKMEMKTLHDALKNSIMDKPVYVTVDAIEYLGKLGNWTCGATTHRTVMDPLPCYMIEIAEDLIVNTTEWKWVIK